MICPGETASFFPVFSEAVCEVAIVYGGASRRERDRGP
jgi:hypothetical protein